MAPEDNSSKTRPNFNHPDADIIVQSSDNVEFKWDSKILACCSPGFLDRNDISRSPSEGNTTVTIPESAEILELLFSFFYPAVDITDTLQSMPFDRLYSLAGTVEKYKVPHGMIICRLCIQMRKEEAPLDVLVYAHAHGYSNLMDSVAPLTIDIPLETVLAKVHVVVFAAWCRYVERWKVASKKIILSKSWWASSKRCSGYSGTEKCSSKTIYYIMENIFRRELPSGVKEALDVLNREALEMACSLCDSIFSDFEEEARKIMSDVPQFSSLLLGIA